MQFTKTNKFPWPVPDFAINSPISLNLLLIY